MTPQEALALLDNATSSLNLNRASHNKIIEALQVLLMEINKPKAEKEKEEG